MVIVELAINLHVTGTNGVPIEESLSVRCINQSRKA